MRISILWNRDEHCQLCHVYVLVQRPDTSTTGGLRLAFTLLIQQRILFQAFSWQHHA